MDKKTIIGFILIMAVLLLWLPLWNYIFPPEPQPAQPVPADTTAQAPAQPETSRVVPPESTIVSKPPTISEPETTGLAATETQPERLIAIDTKNIKVVLSSIGGTVKQVILKHYLDYEDKQVNLLGNQSDPEWARLGALTIGYNDRLAAFNSRSFQVEGDSTILNKQDSTTSVTFTYNDTDGAGVVKKYTFHYNDNYLFDLNVDIAHPEKLNLAQGITVGWFSPMEPTEYDINQDRGKLGGFFDMSGEFDYFHKLNNDSLREIVTGPVDWVATRTKYFTAVVMAQDDPGNEVVVLGSQAVHVNPKGGTAPWPLFGVGMTYDNPPAETHLAFNIYTGPLDYDRLHKMDKGLSALVDFGWRLFRPFAIAILWFFTNLHKLIGNYGLVIIVFSIIMKIVFWPLSLKSAKSMYKMKEIQPKLQEIKEKFKNDPAKLNSETMKAYKEYGVNPFGSCLPMLIQLPIFWALYAVLGNTIELRRADFVWWITDLSQPDPTGKIIGSFIHLEIGVLPIIMGLAMFFQQKMTITDPKQKMMVYMMPIIFTYLFSRWASGLVLYWTVFSLIGIIEQWMVQRHIKAEKEARGVT
jgi:YidC/Oxa1 family membrane protein insertase